MFRSLWNKGSSNKNFKYADNFKSLAAIEFLQGYRYSIYIPVLYLEDYSSITYSKNIPLEQGSTKSSCKGPNSKCFSFCGPRSRIKVITLVFTY